MVDPTKQLTKFNLDIIGMLFFRNDFIKANDLGEHIDLDKALEEIFKTEDLNILDEIKGIAAIKN